MVGKNISLIFRQLKLNLQKEYQYKSSFYTQILMMIINNSFFIIQWLIIYNVTDSIGGYEFNDIMLLWGIAAVVFGVAYLLFDGVHSIGNMIYNGKLDVFLTQPRNVLINVITSRSSVSAIGDILYGFIVFAIVGATWWQFLLLLPIGIIGAIIYVAVIVCFQSLGFFIKDGSSLAEIVSSAFFQFGNYPPVIFDNVVRVLMYTIIPCGFALFVPLDSVFLGFNIWWILGMLGFGIVMVILAFILFSKGLKRYNSGNLMGGRL